MSRSTRNFLDRCRVVLSKNQQIIVKEIHTNGCFYLQLLETDDAYKLDEMYARLGRQMDTPPWRKYAPKLGEIVLAYSKSRNCLSRSEVVSLFGSQEQVRVFHVDYGSYESVPLSRLAPLPTHATQPTRQAVKCCLCDATCLTPEGVDTLSALVLEKELGATLQWSYDSVLYYVSLSQQSGKGSIGELLISQGMATPLVRSAVLEVGLEVECHLSAVISPSELYFHFSSDLKSLRELESKINSSRLSPFRSMAPLPDSLAREGAYCLVQSPVDMMKYRARISYVRPSDRTAQVSLVDFGDTLNVGYDQLFIMTPDTAEEHALCFASCLRMRPTNSPSWRPEAREALLSLGKEHRMNFQVVVKNRIGTVHWLRVFSADTRRPLEESLLHLGSRESNYYLSLYRAPHGLSLGEGQTETVCVTHVLDWNTFYVQLTKHSRELDWLTERLAETFADTELDEQCLRSPTEGVLCAAPYYEANTWARAVVTRVPHCTGDKVQLFYIDYGNKDEVLPYDLKIIPNFAMHLPAMAVESGLSATKQRATYNLEEFKELVTQKALSLTVIRKCPDKYFVTLVDKMTRGGVDILDSLEIISNSSPVSSTSFDSLPTSPLSPVAIPMRSLPLNKRIKLTCTHADSPNHFRCQLLSRTETSLRDLTHQIQMYAGETATRLNTRDIRQGMPIIACSPESKHWHRAVIVEKELRGFIVDLVDCGNKIKIQAHDMIPLPPQFFPVPAFSITCKINQFKQRKCSEEESEAFRKIILGSTFKAVLKSVQKKIYGIEIIESDILSDLEPFQGKESKKVNMISAPKHFLDSLKLDAGSDHRLVISYVYSPGQFFCQLQENSSFFEDFQQRLTKAVSTVASEQIEFEEGNYCAAFYHMDMNFYRAKIVSLDPVHDAAEIFYVDYGDTEVANIQGLRCIPEEFAQLPMQAICCSLWGMCGTGTLEGEGWHSDTKNLMDEFFESNEISVHIHEVERGKYHVPKVSLELLQPLGLTELLVKGGYAIFLSEKTDIPGYSVAAGTSLQIVVSHITREQLVFCVPCEHGPEIDQLVSSLEACHSHSPLPSPKVGQFVVARSPSSGLWNRARVLNRVEKKMLEVTYIDIGNKETVATSNIRRMPSYAASVPCQTFPCRLSQLDNYSSSHNFAQKFRGLVGAGMLTCEVHTVDKEGMHHVTLRLPGRQNLIDELFKQGAIFEKIPDELNSIYPSPQPEERYSVSIQNTIPVEPEMSITPPATHDVVVSHLDNPGNFYVQFTTSHAQLQMISDQINQHYSNLSEMELNKITPTNIVIGAVCCTRFSQDNMWYRGKVADVTQNEVIVQYVDFGNSETKTVNDIKLMHPSFYTLPSQAIKCCLVEVASNQEDWAMEACQLFQTLTFNKLLHCNFLNKKDDGSFYVSLIDPQSRLNISRVLISSGYTKSGGTTKKNINDLDIKSNTQESVYISDVKNPEHFHLHLSSYESNLNQFMDQITSFYSRLQPNSLMMKTPVVGDVCCVKYLDSNWYRAIVKEVKSSNATVYMVDYGNVYEAAVKDCRELHDSFYKFPKHSIECCLHDVTLGATYTDWLPNAINFFKQQTEKQQLVAKFIQKTSEERWEVTLLRGNRDIGKLICESGMAISKSFAARYAQQVPPEVLQPATIQDRRKMSADNSPLEQMSPKYMTSQGTSHYNNRSPKKVKEIVLPRGHVCEAYLTYAISPTDFSIQLTEYSAQLDTMMEDLTRHCEASFHEQVPRAQPQMMVAAKFTEDDKWYRAVVIGTDSPGIVKVQYIDYGNKEMLDIGRIKPLPNHLSTLQAQAIRCALRGFSKDTKFAPELMEQFKQTVTDRYFTLQVLNFHMSYYEVDLVDNTTSQSMAAVFLAKTKNPGSSQLFLGDLKPLILSNGTELIAQLCVMNSPNDFYLQIAETSEALNSMEFQLNKSISVTSPPKVFDLKVGVPCAACFSSTGTWYRAKVLAASSPKIHVLYVDYGNDEWLLNEKIQPLPQKFLSLPCQAFRCALRPQQNRYTDEDVEKFKNKLTDILEIRVKIVGQNDQSIYVVELYSQQTNESLKFTSSQPSAYPPITLPSGTIDRFKVCHILPSGVFYIQRANAASLLDSISAELASYVTQVQMGMRAEELQPGTPCGVKFYQDNQWYRGKVIRLAQMQVELQFVDYGNDDLVSIQSVVALPDVHLNHPMQALPATLQSRRESGKPSIRELEEFQEKTHEQIMKVKIITKESDVHVVRLYYLNDEEIFIGPPGLKPPGYRKGRPGEDTDSPTESGPASAKERLGGKQDMGSSRFGSAPPSRDEWRKGEDEGSGFRQRGEGGFNRERGEGGFNRDRGEGGFNRERGEGGFNRERREGGYNRDRSEGGFNRDRSEGGFSRERSEGGFNKERSEGGFNKERSEGGFNKERGEGGFNRERREGGYNRDRSEGGYNRDRSEGGYNRDRSEGGYNRDRNEGGFNRERREGGYNRERGEGGFKGRDGESRDRFDKGEGGYRGERSERGFKGRNEGGSRDNYGDRNQRDQRSERNFGDGEKKERGFGGRDSGDRDRKGFDAGEKTESWNGSEDAKGKSDVLGTGGWAKQQAESKQESVHWDTKPEIKSTDSYTEEKLVINQAYEAYIPYIVSSKEFYCSLAHKSESLNAVMKKLDDLGTADTLVALSTDSLTPGKAAVAIYSLDNGFYRAKVLSVPQSGMVEVQYVDYGNSEKVEAAKLKTIPVDLLALPTQAIPCMLPQEDEKFREIIEAHESVKIKASSVDGEKTTVDIFTTDGKIIYKMKPSPVGKKLEVYFSHVHSPYEFYCQSTNTTSLDNLMNLLSELTNRTPLPVEQIKPGEICVAVFSVDEALYRGIILQILDVSSQVLVQFMDYGNSEVVHPSKISQMPSNISSFPSQAYRCAVLHPTFKLTEGIVKEFVDSMNAWDRVTIDIKEAHANQYLLVEILDSSGKPIPLPFTVPTSSSIAQAPLYAVGAGVKCGISHVVSPSEFYCQSLAITEPLEAMMNSIDNDVTNNLLSKLKSLDTGIQCVAQFSEDNGWYRSVITQRVDAYNFQVFYLDYGNSELVNDKNIYGSKPEYLAIPPYAFKCGVTTEEPVDGWGQELISEFSSRVKELNVIVQICEVSSEKKYKVRLLDEFGIEELALPEIKPSPPKEEKEERLKFKSIPLPQEPINVFISSINSIHLFYVQQSGCEAELGQLMQDLEQVCTSGNLTAPDKWFPGMICLAKFTDGAWYRGQVNQVTEEEVLVTYVDYGNSEMVSKTAVLSINSDFIRMPFAWPCEFAARYGIRSSAEIETKFAEFEGEALVLTVVQKSLNGVFECEVKTLVDTTDDPVDIGNELCELLTEEVRCAEMLRYCERTAEEFTNSVLNKAIACLSKPLMLFHRDCLAVGSVHTVYLTHTDSGQGLLYFQLAANATDTQQLMDAIALYCCDQTNLVKPDELNLGSACLTKFSEDEMWYRAVVQEKYLEFDHVKVQFVDYGNTQITPIDSIVAISTEFLKTPVYSCICKLDTSYLIPEGFNLASTLSDYEIESLLEIEVSRIESGIHFVKLREDSSKQDLGQIISCGVPVEMKQQILCKLEAIFVQNLVNGLVDKVANQLSKGMRQDESSDCLNNFVNSYVDGILENSLTKLEQEQECAVDSFVNVVLNLSSNHVARIQQGYTSLSLLRDSRFSVNLSHIQSAHCFYIQVLSQAVDLFQVTEEIETYCAQPANTLPLDHVDTNMPVLAVFSQDSTWYRGLTMEEELAGNKRRVKFVDFGNSDEISEQKICHLPDQLLAKQCFSYECRLSGEYELRNDEKTTALFSELTELKTDLMLEVIGFSEGVYEVRLFEADGKEIGITINTLPFSYPDPNDPPHQVTLTCFNSHESFFLQTLANQASLTDLQIQMAEYCSKESVRNTPVPMEQLTPNTLVLISLDECWNRATILSYSQFSGEVQGRRIDYGDIQTVPVTQVRLLPPSSPIAALPAIAFHCTLPAHYCILPCPPVGQEIVRQRDISATFSGPFPPDNRFEAELFDGSERLAPLLRTLSHPFRRWQYAFPAVDAVMTVFISAIDSVDRFYVQESDSDKIISDLMEKVSLFCQYTAALTPVRREELCEGMALLAVFSEDEQWYRAKVDRIGEKILVSFVDYGNTDEIDVGQIRHIPCELLSIPPLAYPCKFQGEIGLVSGAEVETSFQAYSQDVELSLKVLLATDTSMEVELRATSDRDVDIGKKLFFEMPEEIRSKVQGSDQKESIFGQKTGEQISQPNSENASTIYKVLLPPVNSTIKGLTTNIVSLRDFYIQDNNITSDLVRLAEKTGDIKELIPSPDVVKDALVLAKFSEDEQIYRARVLAVEKDCVNVFFIDYGNSDSVPKSAVFSIPNDLVDFPCFALPCALDCDLEVSELSTEKLSNALEGKDIEVVIRGHLEASRMLVDISLIENGENIVDILREALKNEKPESEQDTPGNGLQSSPKKLCKAIDTPALASHPPLPSGVPSFPELDLEKEDGSKFEATLTHSYNLSSFYIHKKSAEDQVNDMMDKLHTYCGGLSDTPPPLDILPGMAVIAMLDEQGLWYRGQIVDKNSDDTYSVFSVDYGNIEKITADKIMPIAPEFLQEPLAYPCKLYLANDKDLPDSAFDTFTNLMDDTVCQVEVTGVEDCMLEVTIKVKEGDVFTLVSTQL